MKTLVVILWILGSFSLLAAQTSPSDRSLLTRHYREGEKLTYHMNGVNEQWHYEIQADGVVERDSTGTFVEEYRWSNLISDHQKVALSSADADFRQVLSLEPNHPPAIPNLSHVEPRLIGPITDLLNFYADLWLAERSGQLVHAGDHFYFHHRAPNSWADGTRVLVGEDSIDFDFTLKEIKPSEHTATIGVHHGPPERPAINLVAEWMSRAVADTPNNWVQVQRTKNGKYSAAVGKETFDVEMILSLEDGRILLGTLDNPVETIERECDDSTLTHCTDPQPHSIHRHIEISLQR